MRRFDSAASTASRVPAPASASARVDADADAVRDVRLDDAPRDHRSHRRLASVARVPVAPVVQVAVIIGIGPLGCGGGGSRARASHDDSRHARRAESTVDRVGTRRATSFVVSTARRVFSRLDARARARDR